MESSQQVETITPALAKDVSFSDKVRVVDDAIKSRAAVQKEIKLAWAAVVQVLAKYEVKSPRRRIGADAAAAFVENITIYKPQPEVDEYWTTILNSNVLYHLRNIAEQPGILRLVNRKVRGLNKFLDDLANAKALLEQRREVDEEKTRDARSEYSKVLENYINALESYDETVTSVENVKEYIGIMKEIAGISAIAQGVKDKE